jgi:hypothetical protein
MSNGGRSVLSGFENVVIRRDEMLNLEGSTHFRSIELLNQLIEHLLLAQ